MPSAWADIALSCRARRSARNDRARSRAAATYSLPLNAAETAIGRSTNGWERHRRGLPHHRAHRPEPRRRPRTSRLPQPRARRTTNPLQPPPRRHPPPSGRSPPAHPGHAGTPHRSLDGGHTASVMSWLQKQTLSTCHFSSAAEFRAGLVVGRSAVYLACHEDSADVMTRGQTAALRARRSARPGVGRLWRTGRRAGLRSQVPEPSSDAGGCPMSERRGMDCQQRSRSVVVAAVPDHHGQSGFRVLLPVAAPWRRPPCASASLVEADYLIAEREEICIGRSRHWAVVWLWFLP